MNRFLRFAALLLVGWLAGFAPASAQEVERDIPYTKAGSVELQLDLALPKGDGPFPAVICLHGGGWRGGKRQDMNKTIEVLAGRGFVAAAVSYRLSPDHRFPAQIEDCKAAVRWLRANAAKYKINPERIGALGYSAGGHLACLLGSTDKNDNLEGNGGNPEQSSRVQAVVSFFGPTDFTTRDWSREVEEAYIVPFLGGTLTTQPEVYRKASATTYATRDDPPFIFFHGSEDPVVPIRHSRALTTKLQGVGVPATLVALEGAGHGWTGDRLFTTIKQAVEFLDENLKK